MFNKFDFLIAYNIQEKVKDLMCTNKSHETCWLETNKNMEKLKTENEKYSVCISSIIDLLKSCENKVPRFVDIIKK